MVTALYEAGFKRTGLDQWYFIHADGARFIKVNVLENGLVCVNFNDELVFAKPAEVVAQGAERFHVVEE